MTTTRDILRDEIVEALRSAKRLDEEEKEDLTIEILERVVNALIRELNK